MPPAGSDIECDESGRGNRKHRDKTEYSGDYRYSCSLQGRFAHADRHQALQEVIERESSRCQSEDFEGIRWPG